MNGNEGDTGTGGDKTTVVVIQMKNTVRRKSEEREEENEQQEGIREERRQEQWVSFWRRELMEDDRKQAAELGDGLDAKAEGEADNGKIRKEGHGREKPGRGGTMCAGGKRRERTRDRGGNGKTRSRKTGNTTSERGRERRSGRPSPWDGRRRHEIPQRVGGLKEVKRQAAGRRG